MVMIELRPAVPADLETFYLYESEPEGRRRCGFPERDFETFVKHWETKIFAVPENDAQAVLVDGEIAGNIVCWPQDGRHMVGYWYGQRFWGRGIGGKALAMYLERQMTVRPVYADTVKGNIGSIKLLERCGFTRIDSGEEELALFVLGAEEEPG